MRYLGLALAGVLSLAGAAPAQQPPAPGAAAAAELDNLLNQWEAGMRGVTTLAADEMVRTTANKVFRTTDVYVGAARYLRQPGGGSLALLHMDKRDKPEVFERFLCTGTFLYEYALSSKELRVHELPPPPPGQVADDNLLSFLFGMQAAKAKERYLLTLAGKDEHYFYLDVLPRRPEDKQDFQQARLILSNKTFLPRRLWFMQPNGNEITWDLPKLVANAELDRAMFAPPQPPQGWTMKKMPKANAADARGPAANPVQPRVVRPNQGP